MQEPIGGSRFCGAVKWRVHPLVTRPLDAADLPRFGDSPARRPC
jgi:hypothetical protein